MGPKHTKRQHTVEFSKDDHTRLGDAVSGGLPRGDSHATRSGPSAFPGGPGPARPMGCDAGPRLSPGPTASRLRLYPTSRGTRSAPAVRTRCVRSPWATRTIRTPTDPSAPGGSGPPAPRARPTRRRRDRPWHGPPGPSPARRSAPAGPGDAGYAPLASPRSSAGQSMGLLIPWSQVRVLPGAPVRTTSSRGCSVASRVATPMPGRCHRVAHGRRRPTAVGDEGSVRTRVLAAMPRRAVRSTGLEALRPAVRGARPGVGGRSP